MVGASAKREDWQKRLDLLYRTAVHRGPCQRYPSSLWLHGQPSLGVHQVLTEVFGVWSSPPPVIERHDLGRGFAGDDGADPLGRCAQGVVEKVRVSACCRRLRMTKQTADHMQAQSGTG